jgi:uncharacterized protein (DUF433 family)
VRELLARGASARAIDRLGRPLIYGVSSPEVIRLLVAAGAEPMEGLESGAELVTSDEDATKEPLSRPNELDVRKWVESSPDRCGGTPVFRGTRLPVGTLFSNLADDVPLAEIIYAYSMSRAAAQALLRESQEEIEADVFGRYKHRDAFFVGPPPLLEPGCPSASEQSRNIYNSKIVLRSYVMSFLLTELTRRDARVDRSNGAVVLSGTHLTLKSFFDALASGTRLSDVLQGEDESARKAAVVLLRWSCERVMRSALADYLDGTPDFLSVADRDFAVSLIRGFHDHW